MNKKVTSSKMASAAARILQDENSSNIAKQLAGSVLSQVNRQNETGKDMEAIASAVLRSEKYSDETKSLAASIVSQSDKAR